MENANQVLPDTNELVRQRLAKLAALKENGFSPYGHAFSISTTPGDLKNNFTEKEKVSIAGRLIALRLHGKSVFANLSDARGSIQIYLRKESVGEEAFLNFEKWIDIGDIIGVEGETFRTRTAEPTVHVFKFELLSKSLRPLPEKWHGLTDEEQKYRKRYLDMVMSDETKNTFLLRSRLIAEIRNFLNKEGFLEVETPILQPLPGGALARPFITHHNALGIDLYLRIAPELYLKRMLVGGWNKVYELSRNFRNEGISTRHNPEFTMLEVYEAFADYRRMMDITEKMVCHLAESVLGKLKLEYDGNVIDLTPPWERITFEEALRRYAGLKDGGLNNLEELKRCAAQAGLEVRKAEGKAGLLDELLKKAAAPKFINPTFVYDYPVELSPLARRKQGHDDMVERFQPFICGLEVGNAFSELNDPLEQRERFAHQLKERDAGNEEAHRLDEDFLRALEHGMPPAGGLGIGIDRLTMIFSGKTSIREVILFPVLKPEPAVQAE